MREAIRIIEAEHYPSAANIMATALVAEGTDAYKNWNREAMLALVPHLTACHKTEKTKDGYTGNVLAIIAQINQRQGNYRQVELLLREVLEYETKVYGIEHHEVLGTQCNLAIVLHNQRDYTQALELYQTILTISQQVLGAEHLDTLITQASIAACMAQQGAYHEAIALLDEIIPKQIRCYGETTHPKVQASIESRDAIVTAFWQNRQE